VPAGVREPGTGDDLYYEFDRPEVRDMVPAGARRVLDVGCGGGALGAALRTERGVEVVGVELAPVAVERASARLDRVIETDLDALAALPADAGEFDAVVLADVLEHLRDPARLLRALRPSLAPGATLVISIPNVKHWSIIEPLLVHDRFPYADAGLLDRTHVHLFTLEELGRLLAEEGFAVGEVRLVTDPLPDRLRVLAEVAGALGGAVEETAARLGVYQYLVGAHPG
jgi:methionine biosynthesis protein MetW